MPEAMPELIRYFRSHAKAYSVYQRPHRNLFCISEAIPKLILYIRGHTGTYSVLIYICMDIFVYPDIDMIHIHIYYNIHIYILICIYIYTPWEPMPEAIPKLIRYIKGHTGTYSVYERPHRSVFCISEAIPKPIRYIRGHAETYSVYQRP